MTWNMPLKLNILVVLVCCSFFRFGETTTYKLTYFPVTALGEPIRWILSYSDIEFEDYRFEMHEWQSLKPAQPFGQVPVLEVDGEKLHQSVPITRYFGKKAGLGGKDEWEDLHIDMIMDTITDFRLAIGKYHYEEDEELQKKLEAEAKKDTVPYYLDKFDARVKENSGYLANGKLSWADIYFVAIMDYLNYVLDFRIQEKYANIKTLYDTVIAIPKIKAWIEQRPISEY